MSTVENEMVDRRGIKKPRYMVGLNCKHTMIYESPCPEAGSPVYCRRCGDYATVQTALLEWSIKCKHCTYGRSYGADEMGATRAGTRHAVRYPSHVIEVFQGVDVRHRIGAPKGTNQTIEWNRANPRHQTSLRTLIPNRNRSR